MAVPYQQTGRVQQKTRTREALLAATRALLANRRDADGRGVSGPGSVSRTTAYRYFRPNKTCSSPAYPEIEKESVLGEDPQTSSMHASRSSLPRWRARSPRTIPLRAMLRLSLEHPPSEENYCSDAAAAASGLADALSRCVNT